MTKTKSWVLIVLMSLMTAGCATSGRNLNNTTYQYAPTLDAWMEQEAVPYLIKELGEDPMFKGQPFLLVSLDRDNVSAYIDDLTLLIRERITDGLLTKPGIRMAWRPSSRPLQHHEHLSQVDCGITEAPRFYIGIDVGISAVDNNLHVKIRALNVQENHWVSGFGIAWKGKPTPEQAKAVSIQQPDDHLLGLRPLPFDSGQADLLAAYLSHNLSCLFTRMELSEVIVHVQRVNKDHIQFFDNALSLVKNYLAKYREVQVTEDPKHANILVDCSVHDIKPGLYQVWVTARYKKGDTYVPGMETESYVQLGPGAIQTVSARHHRHPAPEPQPVVQPAPRPAVQPKPQVTPKPVPRPGPLAEDHFNVCFYDYMDGFEQDIYPLLKTYPGINAVNRRYDGCGRHSDCLCYDLTMTHGRMEELMRWLDYRLPKSRTLNYRMQPLSSSSLRVIFTRGFE